MSIMSKVSGHQPRVVIIGGGATGTGIAREAADRGMEVVLLERGELGSGTSSRFHGILHSGARYAVADPAVAAECYLENRRLRKLIPSAIDATGGLFVATNDEEAEYGTLLLQACADAGIPIKEISVAKAHRAEPNLTKLLQRAFTVPDGFINGTELLRINYAAATATKLPATIMTNVNVTGFKRQGSLISAVTVRHTTSGATEDIACDYVVNAAGVWAGQVAKHANIKLDLLFDKGTMIIFKQQLSTAVLNRCRPENDGDLLVSHKGQSIMGTTARVIANPDHYAPTQEEADILLREGAHMVPAMEEAEALRIYAGVRPLYNKGDLKHPDDTREMSRSFRVLDHSPQDVDNFISVVGGKVTLYRRMAEEAVDLVQLKYGS